MDKLLRRYTIIAWFFTANIIWQVIYDIARAALGDSEFSLRYPFRTHLSMAARYKLMYIGMVDFVLGLAWLVMLALLAWTIRADYLGRNPSSPLASESADDKEASNG